MQLFPWRFKENIGGDSQRSADIADDEGRQVLAFVKGAHGKIGHCASLCRLGDVAWLEGRALAEKEAVRRAFAGIVLDVLDDEIRIALPHGQESFLAQTHNKF